MIQIEPVSERMIKQILDVKLLEEQNSFAMFNVVAVALVLEVLKLTHLLTWHLMNAANTLKEADDT